MSSVIPASMTTCRPPRSRTWRTRATSQPARATSARPGSIARRLGRRSAGTASSRAGSSRAKRSGAGPDSSSGEDREPATDVERVEVRRARRRAARRPRGHAGRHPATRRPRRSCDPTCRWTPRGRTAPAACELIHSTSPVASVSVIPNFDPPSPTARPAMVSGVTSGLSRTRTSRAGRSPRPSPARRAIRVTTSASSADSRATHRSGDPVAAARTAARRSASVLPTPSSVIRPFGHAGATGDRPFAARDDVGAEPARGDLGDDRRDVVGLDRVLAQPRVGEGVADRRRGPIERGEVGQVDRRPVGSTRAAERIGDGREAERRTISRRRCPVAPFRGSVATPCRGGQAARRC